MKYEGRNYTIISTDGHAGADLLDYRSFLDSAFREEFDAWASAYSDAWSKLDPGQGKRKVGVASFLDPVNWDSAKRTEMLEEQGIAAELLFPNTVPPFFPSGVISAPGPTTKADYERRWAGVRAHNRWLAEFCSDSPGRRGGIAQIFCTDIADGVKEVEWARENGLAGILLPADHLQGLENLYYPRLDPLWDVCQSLDMPVHRHLIIPSEAAGPEAGLGASAIGNFEAVFYGQRSLAHVIIGGVFERFPRLKFVHTEIGAAWAVGVLENLDYYAEDSKKVGTIQHMFANEAFSALTLKPSEYARRNCYFGAFMDAADVESRHALGSDRVMWAADFPHHEGTWPWTRKALRVNFAGIPEGEVRRLTSVTAAECYGFDLDRLQLVADRIGPSVGDLAEPLDLADYPRYPEETITKAFVPFCGMRIVD
jgi:predicted TIM-barrel fold metal-dependent hydrolase